MAKENDDTSGALGFEEKDLISLGEKLAALALSEGERAALSALVTDDEVVGFGRYNIFGGIQMGIRTHNMAQRDAGKRAPGVRIMGVRDDWGPPVNHQTTPGEF